MRIDEAREQQSPACIYDSGCITDVRHHLAVRSHPCNAVTTDRNRFCRWMPFIHGIDMSMANDYVRRSYGLAGVKDDKCEDQKWKYDGATKPSRIARTLHRWGLMIHVRIGHPSLLS